MSSKNRKKKPKPKKTAPQKASSFKFDLGARVKMVDSYETGVVTGRAEYDDRPSSYLVRYRTATGCQQQDWFSASDIQAAA